MGRPHPPARDRIDAANGRKAASPASPARAGPDHRQRLGLGRKHGAASTPLAPAGAAPGSRARCRGTTAPTADCVPVTVADQTHPAMWRRDVSLASGRPWIAAHPAGCPAVHAPPCQCSRQPLRAKARPRRHSGRGRNRQAAGRGRSKGFDTVLPLAPGPAAKGDRPLRDCPARRQQPGAVPSSRPIFRGHQPGNGRD